LGSNAQNDTEDQDSESEWKTRLSSIRDASSQFHPVTSRTKTKHNTVRWPQLCFIHGAEMS